MAHLNDHMEASVDDHLEMTWSSLVQAKEELDNMRQKFYEVQEANQKMAESFGACRAEIRGLSLKVENLELENIVQKKMIEDMARKTSKELKSVESRVLRYAKGRTSGEDTTILRRLNNLPREPLFHHDTAVGSTRSFTHGFAQIRSCASD